MSFITDELLQFIIENQAKDSYRLALQRDRYPSAFLDRALPAIQARQKLARKVPSWAAHPRVFISDPTIVEQASSWETSLYKASLIPRGATVMDLTGGMGSDTYAFAERAAEVIYLEPDTARVEAARHNFAVLGADHIIVREGRAEVEGIDLIHTHRPDVIYIDPDRRPSDDRRRTFDLCDSVPDVTTLLPAIRRRYPDLSILLKLSPMMDVTRSLELLGADCDVHVVSLRREAKELLLHYHPTSLHTYVAVELTPDRWCQRLTSPATMEPHSIVIDGRVGRVVYDLYPSVAKLGIERFRLPHHLWQPARHTHLYFSDDAEGSDCFPGRAFRVLEAGAWDKKRIRRLADGEPLHLLTKNFPISTDRLRTQLRIREGGARFLIAYTDHARSSAYLIAEPLG